MSGARPLAWSVARRAVALYHCSSQPKGSYYLGLLPPEAIVARCVVLSSAGRHPLDLDGGGALLPSMRCTALVEHLAAPGVVDVARLALSLGRRRLHGSHAATQCLRHRRERLGGVRVREAELTNCRRLVGSRTRSDAVKEFRKDILQTHHARIGRVSIAGTIDQAMQQGW